MVLALWQLIGELVGAFKLSSPLLIVQRIVEGVVTGSLWSDLGNTMIETFAGLTIGMVVGVARCRGSVGAPTIPAAGSRRRCCPSSP